MALIASQREKMGELIHLIRGGSKRILLKGSAGTGKTFMTNELIKILKRELYSYGAVYVTAPTHKALSVLQTKIEEKPYIKFQTIHAALSLKHKRNPETGQSYFTQEINPRFPPFRAAQAIILDEASMVGSDLLKYIEGFPDLLFIFCGDDKQLNPVGELNSPVFEQGWDEVELTEIVRQGHNSPIIDLSRNLDLIFSKQGIVNEINHGYFFDNNRHTIVEKLAEVNGTDDLKYLAYTNVDVKKMNFDVRKRIYGNPSKIELRESLLFNAPYISKFTTNQEIKVNHLQTVDLEVTIPNEKSTVEYIEGVGELKHSLEYPGQVVPLKTYIINGNIKVVHEASGELFRRINLKLKSDCSHMKMKWPVYFTFLEQFADLGYNHAITVHKSQGSTYRRAVINVQNISFNKDVIEKQRMYYTAVTRASEKVCLFNVR